MPRAVDRGQVNAGVLRQIVRNKSAVVAGVSVASLFLSGNPAEAQDAHRILRERLAVVADRSYQTLARDFEIVDAATGETGHTTFQTVPGKLYFVYGLCDTNCTNIDLELSDPTDKWFAEHDRRPDPSPVVTIPNSDASKEFGIVLDMVACEAETCAMGIAIYAVDVR